MNTTDRKLKFAAILGTDPSRSYGLWLRNARAGGRFG